MKLSTILSDVGALARDMPLLVAAAVAVPGAAGVMIDTLATGSEQITLGTFATSILQLIMQLIVVRAALRLAGVERLSSAGIGGLFLINIPLTIGVGLGVALLVLPGLYLSARWRVAVPSLLAEDVSIMEALRISWDRTRAHWGPLMGASALIFVGYLTSAAILMTFGGDDGSVPLAASVVSNLCLYGAIAFGSLVDVAAYRALSPGRSGLVETFA